MLLTTAFHQNQKVKDGCIPTPLFLILKTYNADCKIQDSELTILLLNTQSQSLTFVLPLISKNFPATCCYFIINWISSKLGLAKSHEVCFSIFQMMPLFICVLYGQQS